MTTHAEQLKKRNQTVMIYFKDPFNHSFWEINEDHKVPQPGNIVAQSRFKPGISETQFWGITIAQSSWCIWELSNSSSD
jgi:hypothetical protein